MLAEALFPLSTAAHPSYVTMGVEPSLQHRTGVLLNKSVKSVACRAQPQRIVRALGVCLARTPCDPNASGGIAAKRAAPNGSQGVLAGRAPKGLGMRRGRARHVTFFTDLQVFLRGR